MTSVVIIGAGVAGLTLGNFLQRGGVACTILEKRSRGYCEQRQRAGTIDSLGVRMYREWGLGEVIEGDPIPDAEGGFWIDGQELALDFGDDPGDDAAVFCPQQVLVRNLTNVFLREGGDLRYECGDVALSGLTTDAPRVTYGHHTLTADFVAGCDGDRGVSRTAIPPGVLRRYEHEYGYSWLSALAATPTAPSGMAIHERGLAGLIPRGPRHTRIYLQTAPADTTRDWPESRIWTELEARFARPVARGPLLESRLIPLRSVVHAPMQYGRLYLLGDAAHIVPPMSAKGIHLALYDTEVFARAVLSGDSASLAAYSDTCLPHIWNYQAFAAWITETMHNAGDPTYAGEFRKHLARAELQRQFASPTAAKLFAELTAGTN
ncbi:4-hydroxybenzoate 3-monooxygenase [Dactylosporangium sp. NPDC051541]|uniref:4-hydroxybenzoate 3-monooxygenase n=1 Tax=Dactylosporangium sp. NPDC051541 TaxID=3363977 RepID=UPI0037BB3CA4